MSLKHLCGHFCGIDFIPLSGVDAILHRSASVDLTVVVGDAVPYHYRLHFHVNVGILPKNTDDTLVATDVSNTSIAMQFPTSVDTYIDALEDYAESFLRMSLSQSGIHADTVDYRIDTVTAHFDEPTKAMIIKFYETFTTNLVAARSNEL